MIIHSNFALMNTKVKYFLLVVFLSLTIHLSAQRTDFEMIETPSLVFKIAPRIFSPRLGLEKVLDEKSSLTFEGRFYTLWIPQGGRIEPGYRRYFKPSAPFGGYVNIKAGIGYFSYQSFGYFTNGFMAGGGVNFGGQFNVGRKKAIIDVFGGLQLIAPIYLSVDGGNISTFNNVQDYNLIHYFFTAFPIEFGIRFGFFNTIKTPKKELEKDIFYDYTY